MHGSSYKICPVNTKRQTPKYDVVYDNEWRTCIISESQDNGDELDDYGNSRSVEDLKGV